MSPAIVVFAEQRGGKLRASAFEAATVGRQTAAALGLPLVAVIVGSGVKDLGHALGAYGVERVVAFDHPDLALAVPAAYARLLADAARELDARAVFGSASAMGRDLLPRVAALLEAGLVSDATAVNVTDGQLRLTRPVFAGKALATLAVKTPIAVVGLRPKIFSAQPLDVPVEPSVDVRAPALAPDDLRARVREIVPTAGGVLDVAEADIIVSGGRSLKNSENFAILEELARVLGAAVGASRAAVDAGYRPHRDQVGLTGKLVSPTLYVACGISGAIQHLAGMSGSKVIVAINKDAEAPMVKRATYAVIGDLFEIVPALTKELSRVLEEKVH
jgi:electron transfer flavoprotein alpha subunit